MKLLSLAASLLFSQLCFLLFPCSYIEKFTDFLRLFVSVHLRRIESYSQFPVVEFLALLFKYTFHQVRPCDTALPRSVLSAVARYGRMSFFSPVKLIAEVSSEKKQLTGLTGASPVVLGAWKWLNVLSDLVGRQQSHVVIARTTRLVLNLASAFILFYYFFLLVLGTDDVVWKNVSSSLVLCLGMLFFHLNLLLLLYPRLSL